MRTLYRWMRGAPTAALLLTAAAAFAGMQEKKYKDDAEFPLSDAAFKAVTANDWQKALPALEAWKQKYPESDWKQDRDFYLLQGYFATKQLDKTLGFGSEFIDRDLPALFKDKASMGKVAGAYFIVISAAAQLMGKDVTPEQLATGDKAAHKLLDFAPVYFVPANMPAGQTAQAFEQAKQQMLDLANGYLLQEDVLPGQKAEAKKDCPAAEAAFTKALNDYPNNTYISRHLASAYNCDQKPFLAMYEFARTAVIDPTQGKTADGDKFLASTKKMYVALHGGEDGFDELLTAAKAAPIPPPDFKIMTAEERRAKAAEDFAKDNPELARWQGIKTNLTQQGATLFQSMKGAEVPGLMATIADAQPACHSRELTLYVPEPDNTSKTAEITLKLDAPLTGQPEIGAAIRFAAVADSFTATPFMLAMSTSKDKIQGLKETPCTPTAARKKK